MKLELALFGECEIIYEGKRVQFKFRKAEALFYYIALNGGASRDELKTLFWPEMSESQASSNLRNALYLIKSQMPEALFADRQNVRAAAFDDGLFALQRLCSPKTPLPEMIFSTPLRDYCANSEPLSEWLEGRRAKINADIVEIIKKRADAAYESGETEAVRTALEAERRLDPFDECSMLELMELYLKSGERGKAVLVYKNFAAALKEKLSLEPSDRAQKYYASIVNPEPAPNELLRFRCRKRELALLTDGLSKDRREKNIFLIEGEAGIGKSALVDEALRTLQHDATLVLATKATPIGEGCGYSAWNNFMTEALSACAERGVVPETGALAVLGAIFPCILQNGGASFNADIMRAAEINPVTVASLIAELLRPLSSLSQIVFIFEDVHWFDDESFKLMGALLSAAKYPYKALITARPEAAAGASSLLRQLNAGARIHELKLRPFRDDEILFISRSLLPKSTMEQKGDAYFIRESEGLPLMLFEMLRALREDPRSECEKGLGVMVWNRIGTLGAAEKKILSAAAVCISGTPAVISEMTGMTQQRVIYSANALIARGLLCERQEGRQTVWGFLHQKLRECVYAAIPYENRRELHAKAAAALSARYAPQRWDPALGAMLCHHYIEAGDRVSELKQYLSELIFEITLNHDIFPTLSDRLFLSCSTPYSSREETEKKIGRVIDILDELRCENSMKEEDFARLEATSYELAGGFHIFWGEYEKGKVFTREALSITKRYCLDETSVYCLKHYCYMYIQIADTKNLRRAARELLRQSKKAGLGQYFATAIRFIGMAAFMESDYDLAEKIFRHSIKKFDELRLIGRRYTLGILVAKCYLGEIAQRRGLFEEGAAFFAECAAKCEEMKLFWGRSYFHMAAANIAVDMNDMPELFRQIDDAVSLFESCRGGRCGSILYSLKAIADAERLNFAGAKRAYEKAELLIKHVPRIEWMAAQHLAAAWIARLSGYDASDDAAMAVKLYEKIGFTLRARAIREKFALAQER
ncbi:MAG: AAA family ATPase [Cloacibacillus sp.]